MEGLLPDRPYPRVPIDMRVRTKPMQVLCLGLSRTATMSTYAGLKKLGYTPYHAAEMGLDAANDSLIHWTEAANAKYRGKGAPYQGKDFDKILWRYDAITDIPCVLFTDELLEAYPDAKVIVTTRDVDSWLQSMKSTFYVILSWKGWIPLQFLDRSWTGLYIPLLRLPLQIWSHNNLSNPESLKQGFHEHYTHVRKIVPKDRLLEWHPRDGWQPLCRHLGKEVPKDSKGTNVQFPHINDPKSTLGLLSMVFWMRCTVVGVKVAGWAIVGGVSWFAWTHRTAFESLLMRP